MDMNDLKGVLASVAPVLGTALGGPFGAVAGNLVRQALLPAQDPATVSDEQVAAAVASMTPDAAAKLKQAELDFQVKIAELHNDAINAAGDREVAALKVDADDRASARAREEAVKDIVPMALAFVVTVGFFSILTLLLFNGVPSAGHDALMVMLGTLGTSWISIIAYYFGSSAGSARKTALLAKNS